MHASKFIVCEHCDVVYERADLVRKQTAFCVRCGAELYRGPTVRLQTMLALIVTSLFVFIIANAYPLVAMDMNGVENRSTLLGPVFRSEEHTSELQSLMRISYAVFCLKKQKNNNT